MTRRPASRCGPTTRRCRARWAVNACCDVGQSRRRGLGRQGLRRHARRPADRARCGDRQAALGRARPSTRPSPTRSPARRAWSKGKVLIGNGGAEFGVRGYVSAYDADDRQARLALLHRSGRSRRTASRTRFSKKAAKTWSGEWWKLGGGGTVWDSMAYDPRARSALHRRRATARPWNQHAIAARARATTSSSRPSWRSRPTTARYVWHYQTTPGETWDYTATQQIILADLNIDGEKRKRAHAGAEERLLLCAGSRRPGELISAKNFTDVSWATHIDMKTGRPVENPAARYNLTGKLFHRCRTRTARTRGTRCRSARRPGSSTFRSTSASFIYGIDADSSRSHGAPTSVSISAAMRSGHARRAAGRARQATQAG